MGVNQRQGALDGVQTSVGERVSPLLGHVSSACPTSAVPDPVEVALHPPPSPLQRAQPLSQPHTVAPPHRTASHPQPAPPRRTAAPRPRRTPGPGPVLGRRGALHLGEPSRAAIIHSIPSAAGASPPRSVTSPTVCERLPRVRCTWSGTVQHQSGSQTGSPHPPRVPPASETPPWPAHTPASHAFEPPSLRPPVSSWPWPARACSALGAHPTRPAVPSPAGGGRLQRACIARAFRAD
jgi:hypothetical protein